MFCLIVKQNNQREFRLTKQQEACSVVGLRAITASLSLLANEVAARTDLHVLVRIFCYHIFRGS